ncbi:MAG: protein phosphatase 2C domain-containing protein [Eubacterium sp.]
MKISSLTDIGNTREMNQDYLYSSEESVGKLPNLFLVADGMGGHKAGEFASRYVVEHIVRSIKGSKEEEAVGILSESIETANRKLKEYADAHQQMRGMGTTIVAAVIQGRTLLVANVGDSRLYIVGDEITLGKHRIIRWYRRWCVWDRWIRRVQRIIRIKISLPGQWGCPKR